MKLIFRVNASNKIGLGHFMRCIALAQAWNNIDRQAIFVMSNPTPFTKEKLANENCKLIEVATSPGSIEDAAMLISLAPNHAQPILVIDGYDFGAEYQFQLRAAGLQFLVIDDYVHASHYCADFILNQNICAKTSMYSSREPYTKLLLGTQFILLRKEFNQCINKTNKSPNAPLHLLVTMGGADPDNTNLRIVKILEELEHKNLEVSVLTGPMNSHIEELNRFAKKSILKINLLVGAENIPELFASVDAAISAGGTTLWELLFMGVPIITLIDSKDQENSVAELSQQGAVLNLGWHNSLTDQKLKCSLLELLDNQNLRKQLSKQGKKLIDGQGAARVVTQLIRLNDN